MSEGLGGRAGRGTHLGRDELKTGKLPPGLPVDDLLDLGVDLGEGLVQRGILVEHSRRQSTLQATFAVTHKVSGERDVGHGSVC